MLPAICLLNKKPQSLAELRTIGFCDASDSELSIRHLELTPNESEISFHLSPNTRHESTNNGSRHPSTSSATSRDSVSDRSSSPTANLTNYETNNRNEQNCDIIVNVTNSDASSKNSKRIDRNFEKFFCSTTSKWSNKADSKKYHSIKNRLRNEAQVGRSKSFQEQDVKPITRYSRFFTSRHHDDMSLAEYNKYSSETVSHHNIEITIEDTDSTTESKSCSCQRLLSDSPVLSSHIQNRKDSLTVPAARKPYKLNMDSVRNVKSGHIIGRIFRRMRKITVGWRKTKCKTRRGVYLFLLLCFMVFFFSVFYFSLYNFSLFAFH